MLLFSWFIISYRQRPLIYVVYTSIKDTCTDTCFTSSGCNHDSSSNSNNSNRVSEDIWKISGSTDTGPDNFYIERETQTRTKRTLRPKTGNQYLVWTTTSCFQFVHRACKIFEGVDWSQTNPTPVSLAEAGFF
jgi:hypothetical protein